MRRREILELLGKGTIALAAYATGCTNNRDVSYNEQTPTPKYSPTTPAPEGVVIDETRPNSDINVQIATRKASPQTYSYLTKNVEGEWIDNSWIELTYPNQQKKYIVVIPTADSLGGPGMNHMLSIYLEEGGRLSKIKEVKSKGRFIEFNQASSDSLMETTNIGGDREIAAYSIDLDEVSRISLPRHSIISTLDLNEDGRRELILTAELTTVFQVYDSTFSRSVELERQMDSLYSNFSSMASNRNLSGLTGFQNEFSTQLALACVRVFPVPNPKGGLMSFDSYVRQLPGFERFDGTPLGRDPVGVVGRVLIGAETPEEFARSNYSALGILNSPFASNNQQNGGRSDYQRPFDAVPRSRPDRVYTETTGPNKGWTTTETEYGTTYQAPAPKSELGPAMRGEPQGR